MAKVTAQQIAELKNLFRAGDVLLEDSFAALVNAVAQAAETHEHKRDGGPDTGTGDAGPVINIQSGPAAERPEDPAIGDVWIEHDTRKLYTCLAQGTWGQFSPATSVQSGLEAQRPGSPATGDVWIEHDTQKLYACLAQGTWEQFFPATNVQSGLEAQRPGSPVIGDAYVETDTETLLICYTAGTWTLATTTDHGELENLGADDHLQYLNEERHDKIERHSADIIRGVQSGPAAQMPGSPSAGDVYVATDTLKVYACFSPGTWRHVASPID